MESWNIRTWDAREDDLLHPLSILSSRALACEVEHTSGCISAGRRGEFLSVVIRGHPWSSFGRLLAQSRVVGRLFLFLSPIRNDTLLSRHRDL